MAESQRFDGLTVSVEQSPAGDYYVAYVEANGARIALGRVESPAFEASLADAQAAQDQAELAASREQQNQGQNQGQ